MVEARMTFPISIPFVRYGQRSSHFHLLDRIVTDNYELLASKYGSQVYGRKSWAEGPCEWYNSFSYYDAEGSIESIDSITVSFYELGPHGGLSGYLIGTHTFEVDPDILAPIIYQELVRLNYSLIQGEARKRRQNRYRSLAVKITKEYLNSLYEGS